MKEDVPSLAGIASLLPEQHRERFLITAARFRNVPEDDEYLQILEAIGFMTLIWTTIPDQIRSILDGARPVDLTGDSLKRQIEEAIDEKVPSFEDLRRISHLLRQQEIIARRNHHTGSAPVPHHRESLKRPFLTGAAFGAMTVTLGYLFLKAFCP